MSIMCSGQVCVTVLRLSFFSCHEEKQHYRHTFKNEKKQTSIVFHCHWIQGLLRMLWLFFRKKRSGCPLKRRVLNRKEKLTFFFFFNFKCVFCKFLLFEKLGKFKAHTFKLVALHPKLSECKDKVTVPGERQVQLCLHQHPEELLRFTHGIWLLTKVSLYP